MASWFLLATAQHALLSLRYMSWLNGDWRMVIWDQMSHVLQSPLSHPPKKISPWGYKYQEMKLRTSWASSQFNSRRRSPRIDSIIKWNPIYSSSECRVHQHTHFYRESEGKLPLNYGLLQEGTIVSWSKQQQAKDNRKSNTGKGQEKQEQGRNRPLPLEITQGWDFLSIAA